MPARELLDVARSWNDTETRGCLCKANEKIDQIAGLVLAPEYTDAQHADSLAELIAFSRDS